MCNTSAEQRDKECDMDLGGLNIPLIGGNDNDQSEQSSDSSQGGLLGGLGGGEDGLLGGIDALGIGKLFDKGLDWANDAGLDKVAGWAAGTFGGFGVGGGLGAQGGDAVGDIAAGLNLFGGSEDEAA
jgi:hypothetical protein